MRTFNVSLTIFIKKIYEVDTHAVIIIIFVFIH